MSEKPKRKTPLILAGASLIIVTILMAILFLPLNSSGQAIIYQTQTQTQTQISMLTTTSASVNTATQTITSLITVTQQLPSNVDIDGTAKSNGIGTTATDVIFTDTNSSAVFHAPITNGHYLIHGLPNDKTYLVQIGYSGTPLAGHCDVKIWTVALSGTSTTANLSC